MNKELHLYYTFHIHGLRFLSKIKFLMAQIFFTNHFYVQPHESSIYFYDFDRRNDHQDRVQYFAQSCNASIVRCLKYKVNVEEQRLSFTTFFFRLLLFIKCAISCLNGKGEINIGWLNRIVLLYVYELNSVEGTKLLEELNPRIIMSINFKMRPGFYVHRSCDHHQPVYVSFQHGMLQDGPGWCDFISDYYLIWADEFQAVAKQQVTEKCRVLTIGDPLLFKTTGVKSKETFDSYILFISSISPTDVKLCTEKFNFEELIIQKLLTETNLNSEKLVIRLHPSFNDAKGYPFGNQTSYQNAQVPLSSVSPSIELAITVDSTAGIDALKLGIPITFIESEGSNYKDLLKTISIGSTFTKTMLRKNVANLQDLEKLFFRKDSFDQLLNNAFKK